MTFKNLILGEVRVDFIFKFLSFVLGFCIHLSYAFIASLRMQSIFLCSTFLVRDFGNY